MMCTSNQENEDVIPDVSSKASILECKEFGDVVTKHYYQTFAATPSISVIVKVGGTMTINNRDRGIFDKKESETHYLEDVSKKNYQFL